MSASEPCTINANSPKENQRDRSDKVQHDLTFCAVRWQRGAQVCALVPQQLSLPKSHSSELRGAVAAQLVSALAGPSGSQDTWGVAAVTKGESF